MIQFFSSFTPAVAATGDGDAAVAQITMTPKNITLLMQPALDLLVTSGLSNTLSLDASAAAQYSPVVCEAPPLMVCNPAETGGAALDLSSPTNAGKQLAVKEGPGGVASAPGQFGLLCTVSGQCGANAIGDALAAVNQPQCQGPSVTTAPGSKTQQIRNGFNSRFDSASGANNPSRNIIGYPRDSAHVGGGTGDFLGDGIWDAATYWTTEHPGETLPAELTNASRYQAYLYELGESYAANGKQTVFPIPSSLPTGFAVITPPSVNIPANGVPATAPIADAKRRVVKAAILDCVAQSVAGSGDFPTFGRYVDLFLTEPVPGPPDATAYAEVISAVTESTSADFHANVQLVD